MQIQFSWLLISQLIWIYTVCKGRAYPSWAGQGLTIPSETISESQRNRDGSRRIPEGLDLIIFPYFTYSDRQASANCVDPDQTPKYAASDQGLHCLPITQQIYTHSQVVKWIFVEENYNEMCLKYITKFIIKFPWKWNFESNEGSTKSAYVPYKDSDQYACSRSLLSFHCLSKDITKTCLYNFDPLKPHFYIVKLEFTGYTFLILFLVKNRSWVLVRTASSRRF